MENESSQNSPSQTFNGTGARGDGVKSQAQEKIDALTSQLLRDQNEGVSTGIRAAGEIEIGNTGGAGLSADGDTVPWEAPLG